MAKTYRVVRIKLNQLVKENVHMIALFKRYRSDKYFSEFLPTRRRQKSTGIDMEQNNLRHCHPYLTIGEMSTN